ncbi:hypothetical protein [Tenacibaculum caenipelagi]|nr:hypothetical protein [Tenacibaculum caenipelagi]
MNVINTKKVFFLLLTILFFSCKEKQQINIEEECIYQVTSHLTNKFRAPLLLPPTFPPPPNGKEYIYTTRDSLTSYMHSVNKFIRKKTIAFLPETFTTEKEYKKEKVKIIEECTNDKDLIRLFLKLEKNIELDINKIANSKKDSLIYYNEKHEKMLGKGFQDIDILLSFSNITFNKNYNKALLIVGVSYGRLNGFSMLIYLEKKHYHWEIKCEKILSIS